MAIKNMVTDRLLDSELRDMSKGGKPRKFHTAYHFAEACDAYFTACQEEKQWPTMAGLSLALGFSRRNQIYRQDWDQDYTHVLETARLMVEHAYEQRLGGQSVAGCIFALKQMGWADKQEIDLKNDREIKEMAPEVREAKLKGLIDLVKRERLEDGTDVYEPGDEDWE